MAMTRLRRETIDRDALTLVPRLDPHSPRRQDGINPWVRAACGRDPLRSMRETRLWDCRATEEAPDGDTSWLRCAPRADHLRCARYRHRRGLVRSDSRRS